MTWRAWLAFGALGIIWGLPYFFIKLAVTELAPAVVAWARLLLAAAILLPIAWRRGALAPLRTHAAAILAFAIAEFCVPFTAIALGERWVSSSATGILIAAVPLTITLISRFFGITERLSTWRLVGLVLGLCGVMSLLGFGAISGVLGWAGVGCMLLATVGYAIGPLIIQRHLAGLDAIGPVAASIAVAALVLTVPALLGLPTHPPSMRAVAAIVVLGVVCTALAMLLMFYLVAHAGASRASVITYVNPAVATLLGVAVLHEHLGIGGYVGFALILLGSWLATRAARAPREGMATAS